MGDFLFLGLTFYLQTPIETYTMLKLEARPIENLLNILERKNMVTNLTNEVYDEKTGKFLGFVTFELSQAEEDKLLNLVNYGETPKSLTVLNAIIKKQQRTTFLLN